MLEKNAKYFELNKDLIESKTFDNSMMSNILGKKLLKNESKEIK